MILKEEYRKIPDCEIVHSDNEQKTAPVARSGVDIGCKTPTRENSMATYEGALTFVSAGLLVIQWSFGGHSMVIGFSSFGSHSIVIQ